LGLRLVPLADQLGIARGGAGLQTRRHGAHQAGISLAVTGDLSARAVEDLLLAADAAGERVLIGTQLLDPLLDGLRARLGRGGPGRNGRCERSPRLASAQYDRRHEEGGPRDS